MNVQQDSMKMRNFVMSAVIYVEIAPFLQVIVLTVLDLKFYTNLK
jgi:hypothetical protein